MADAGTGLWTRSLKRQTPQQGHLQTRQRQLSEVIDSPADGQDGKYVNASIVNGYGYAEGDVFDRFSDDYVRTNKKNSATVANNIFSNIEITLSIAEEDTYIREKYARTINGVKYRPNRVTLYSTKDTTFTDLNYQSVINISDTSVLVTPIGDAAVSTVISQLNTNDYILALFRYDDGSSSKVINIGAFQVVMNVSSL